MRKIIHIDMDCFYAAVEVKHRPELKGKPLGVGGPANSRSVLTTASMKRGSSACAPPCRAAQAVRLCPDLILVPPNFSLYKAESKAVRKILDRFTEKIQPLSLDEAYLDVTDALHFGGSATLIAREMRRLISEELGLTASAGIAPNKFLAKIASDWKKPNGQFVIRPQDIEAFMPPLPIEKIHGVGKVTARKMHSLGLRTCGDIQRQPVSQLIRWFGSRGQELSERARGIDHRAVEVDRERKSLSVEETYGTDLVKVSEGEARLPELFADFERRLDRHSGSETIRGWVVKLKFFDFKTTTCEAAAKTRPTLEDFRALLRKAWDRRQAPVRLIGIGVRMADPAPKAQNTDQLTFDF